MPEESVDALKQFWEALVQEHFRARRVAEQRGASGEELSQLDARYGFQIDIAYSELKIAESLQVLRSTLQSARNARNLMR